MQEIPIHDLVQNSRVIPQVIAFSEILFMLLENCELTRKKILEQVKWVKGVKRYRLCYNINKSWKYNVHSGPLVSSTVLHI